MRGGVLHRASSGGIALGKQGVAGACVGEWGASHRGRVGVRRWGCRWLGGR